MIHYAWHMLHQLDMQRLESMSPADRATELHRRMMKRIREKDERMKRRLARYRAAIWKRWWGWIGGAFLFMTALPLAVFVVAELWKLAARSVFE